MRRLFGGIAVLIGAASVVLVCFGWVTYSPTAAAASASPAPGRGPCDSTISFGEVVQCTISTAGTDKQLTFPGAVGDHVRVRVVKTSGTTFDPKVEIKRPNGSVVCPATTIDDTTCGAGHGRTHTVRVFDNAGTNTGSFGLTIQRLNSPVGCVTIAYGNPGVTGSIGVAAELDCFSRSSVAVGDKLRFRVVETGGTLFAIIEVVRPDGTALCAATGAPEVTCTADVAGTYRFLVRDSAGTDTGPYAGHLQKLNNPVGCLTVVYGDPLHTDSIDGAAETDCYRFSGATGDHAKVQAVKTSGTSFDTTVEVVRPDGTTVCSATTADITTCTLDATGMHTVLVRDNVGTFTGGYTFKLDKV